MANRLGGHKAVKFTKIKIKWEMFVLFSTQFLKTVLARFKIGQVAIYGMAYIASLDHWAE